MIVVLVVIAVAVVIVVLVVVVYDCVACCACAAVIANACLLLLVVALLLRIAWYYETHMTSEHTERNGPQPSQRLLTRPKSRSKSRSKSPKAITIQGRNRRWTVKTHQKKATPPNNKTRKSGITARGIKIKNKPKKRSKRLNKKKD